MSERVFLLSPASCAGRRATLLFGGQGAFPLARHLAGGGTAPLGEAFAWLSGLYFRGKLAYARTFARPPAGVTDALVITTNRGLVGAEVPVSAEDLRAFGAVPIDTADPRYRGPLEHDAHALAARIAMDATVVLLGSVASGKYVDVLLDVFGERLHFPREFVGRGDMSRGSLMLRSVESGEELDYVAVAGAVRRGARPPRLEPRRWT